MAYTQRPAVIPAWAANDYDYFATGCAISADGLVLAGVSTGFQQLSPGNITGAVFFYDWNAGTSEFDPRGSAMLPPDPAYDEFEGWCALSGDGSVFVALVRSLATASNRFVTYDWTTGAWVHRSGADIAATGKKASIALSANGNVLVLGGIPDTGLFAADVSVTTYDWSGSAWTQRGSMLTIAAISTDDRALTPGVALSGDASVLAIGVPGRAASSGDPHMGAVVTCDVSGSTWAVRGSTLIYPGVAPPAYMKFGRALALTDTGDKLFVGADGLVYEYDVSGSAWSPAAATIVNADAAGVEFGTGVAVTGDGAVLVVGAPWGSTGSARGCLYVYDVYIVPGPPTGKAVAPTLLTILPATGKAVAPTLLTITASGKAVAPTSLAVVDLSQHWPIWSLRCTIDGVDVSARLKGVAEVEAEEGAARIARFTIEPTSGVIAPLDYVGKPVTLDYLQTIAGTEVARRVFTGRIDTPSFDDAESLLTFECVDDLQNKVAALDRSVIDALCNGRYSTAVQGELLDNWDYAGAVMSTVAGSLDAGPFANIRVTPWELASTWATFTDANLIYPRSWLRFPQRSTLVNRVDINYEYRYPRLRQRYAYTSWGGPLLDMAPNGYAYPTQADILSAAGGSGWEVLTGVFYSAPASIAHSSGGFIYPAADAVDLAILQMAQRHSQTVTETYSLVVRAPESIDANGALPHALRGALQSDFDGGAWESAFDVAPLMPTGGDMDWAPDAPRADSDHAIETLLDQARVIILGSHRGARVGNATVCNPDLDLDKKVAISTTMRTASGKVARVLHSFDLQAGSAVTEFEIACFGVGGAGIITPDTLAAPSPPAEAFETQAWLGQMPALSVNTYGVTPYQDTLMGLLLNTPETITVSDVPTVDGPKTLTYANPFYSAGEYPVTGFRMEMPGVVDADRNPIELAATGDYSIVVPTDTLTTTIP